MMEIKVSEIAQAVSGTLTGDGNAAVKGVSTDTRTARESDVFIALKGESFDANTMVESLDGKVAAVVTNREVKLSVPVITVPDTLIALGKLAEYYAKNIIRTKVNIVLSGSVGKTTTKEMTAAVLATSYNVAYTQGNFNNHIGVPKTLLSVDKEDNALVCEMGMNHRGELEYLTKMVDSDIAMITNIGHSHIENLGSREGIRDAKFELLGGLKKDGTLIVNGDEPLLEKIPFDGRILRVGFSDGCDFRAEGVEMSDTSLSYTLRAEGKEYRVELPCTGKHNVMNSLFALAAGALCGIDIEKGMSGLMNYKSVGNRQNIYVKNGVRVIADCYNAGIESMMAAIDLLDGINVESRRVAVLSDMLELGDLSISAHEQVGERLGKSRVDLVLTYGLLSRHIYDRVRAYSKAAMHFDSREELAEYIKENMKRGDTVLLKASHAMKLDEVIKLADI